jgi:hypothetical protein
MKKLTCTLAIILVALRFANAQEPTEAAPAESSPAPAAQPVTVELKNKSAFSIDETQRNPFWPVGWRPVNKASQSAEAPSSDISPAAFVVSSITVDVGGSFAIINGKVMNEGQVFGLQMGNQTYQLTVKAIQDGQVILGRRDQEIVVPLRRR